MFNFRKSAALVATTVFAASTLLSASAASTGKSLSSNFTLVSLIAGENEGQIAYYKPDGSAWRSTQSFTLTGIGAQAIYRQYSDNELTAGSGSVVVSTGGPVGAVVQIQARSDQQPQVPTSGAYVGVSEGANSANIPLVSRRGDSTNGTTNSQIIAQNAGSAATNITINLINAADGSTTHTEVFQNVPPNTAVEFDLDDDVTDAEVPPLWFGSASVTADTGGQVAVVSNFFQGDDIMQTFNGFTQTGTRWFAPLFTSRLTNSLSTPVAVQNVSGGEIPAGAISLTCTKDPGSTGVGDTIQRTNPAALANTQSVFFNPVTDLTMPENWYGSCIVDSGSFQTAMFVQMRFTANERAGAYEGILATSTAQTVVIPLIAKRLTNGFASAVTVQNLSTTAAANVTLEYKGAIDGSNPPNTAPCTTTINNVTIPAGGSIIENHRVPDGATNSVPEIDDLCVGSLTVTSSNQPIDAFVQLDFTLGTDGDTFMAHTAFPVAAGQ
jgi:hypothetical protein